MWQSTPYTVPLAVAAVISFAVAIYVWRTRDIPSSKAGAVVLLTVAFWIAGYALELARADLPGKNFAEKIQFVSSCILPSALLAYTLQYTGRGSLLTRWQFYLLSVVPLAALLLAITNESHNLIWHSVHLNTSGPFNVKLSEHGIALWVFIVYSYVVLFFSTILLVRALVRSRRLYLWQATVLLSAVLGLWLINALADVFMWQPLPNLDMMPVALSITTPIIAWALFRFRIVDIVPVARETIIESMEDGVLVLDAAGRVVDVNTAAERIGDLGPLSVIGQSLKKAWPELSNKVEQVSLDAPTGMTVEHGAVRRTYDVRVSPLSDWRGHLISQVIVLRDISERKRTEDDLHESETKAHIQLEEQSTLLQATQALTSTLDLQDVLDHLAKEMINAVGVHGCTISQWDREADAVVTWMERRLLDMDWADAPGTSYALKDYPTTRAVLETGQAVTVRVSDPTADSTEVAHLRKTETSTLLMLPLTAGKSVIGLVELDQEEERVFTNDEIRLCQALADQAAVAIENARLLAESERQLGEQTVIREAEAAMSSTLDLTTVLTRVAEQMAQSIDATSAYIVTFDAEAKTATAIAEYYSPDASAAERVSDLGVSHKEDDELWLEVMRAGRHDISHIDASHLTEVERDHMEHYGTQSVLYIPLRSRGQLIGYTELWESRLRREFSPEEIGLCQAIAQSAAVALDNAQLYDQLRQELAGRETLLQITAAVSSSLDLGQILLVLSDRLLRLSEFHSCTVCEWEKDSRSVFTLCEYMRAEWASETRDTYPLQTLPISAKVVRTGQPVVVRFGEDTPAPAWMDELGLKVVLSLPVLVGEETIGLAEIGSLDPRVSFEEAIVQRCQQILGEATSSSGTSLREFPNETLLELASQLASASGGSYCTISEYDRVNDEISSLVEYGDLTWPSGEGPADLLADWHDGRKTLQEGVSIVARIDDPDCDPVTRDDLIRWGGHIVVLIPLSVRGESIGLIELYHYSEQRPVSDDELRLWRAVADQAAIAIENARLYRKAQQDLEELTRSERKLTESVREKEVLLREIHHRVKNNLQIISSLLNLQSGRIDDERVREAFKGSQDRIRSMALVHERLYQSEDLANVDFTDYVQNLIPHLLRSQATDPDQIDLAIDADQVFLDIDSAIPCGLIIGELVSNSLKHAFPAGRRGRISVSLKPREDGLLLLCVSDDGVGIDPDSDLESSETLGLQLVSALAQQMNAEIEMDRGNGTEFRISFGEK